MSSKKNLSTEFIVYCVLFLVVVAAVFVIYPMVFQSTTEVRIGAAKFNAKLATNDVDRLNGLTGVAELRYDEALLKIYPELGKWPVIMNDIKMPIDIVWLNSSKQVVYMVRNAQIPDGLTYKIYNTTKEAKYIMEMPAGSIKERMINLNSIAVFVVDESKVR